MVPHTDADVVIVGAGAAGMAAAVFARRHQPHRRVVLVDGARAPGAKILVSGGSRCNVTNTIVTEADFNGGRRTIIRQILRAFPAERAAAFFREIGVALHEEPGGKLFPDSGSSRTVLDALLAEMRRTGVDLRAGVRVSSIARAANGFRVDTSVGSLVAGRVVLATGGLSLPKTGSDGWGYTAAAQLGHTIVPTTPALAPMVLADAGEGAVHRELSGVSQPVQIEIRADRTTRIRGAMLWTHFGVSGPAVLDASRHWLRARLEGRAVSATANLAPAERFESLDARLVAAARHRSRTRVATLVAELMPAAVAQAVAGSSGVSSDLTLAEMSRDIRRRLVRAILQWPLPFSDSRGYNYAEVTAGGVDLSEIDPATMESRPCPGLYLVGEILDVDGRIGGFNFQWAWSTGWIAGAVGLR